MDESNDKQMPESGEPGAAGRRTGGRGWAVRAVRWLPALALMAPAIWQLSLLVRSWWGRFWYPYDLEWMEGGMLTHAWRLLHGETIYPPPSIDFVPYLYTPLYSAVVAAGSVVSGVSYQIGRAVSVMSIVGVMMIASAAIRHEFDDVDDLPSWMSWVAVFVAVGVIASGYPWTDGWYDIARPDSFLCALGLLGFAGLRQTLARREHLREQRSGWRAFWHPRVAAWGACLALTFFIKQTGVLFVAGAGVAVLFSRWRSVPSFVVSAGLVGLGGTGVLNVATGGWFWRYIFVYHQRHTNSFDRFVGAWEAMFEHLPVVCVVAGLGLLVTGIIWVVGWGARWLDLGGSRFQQASQSRAVTGAIYWGWLAAIGALFGATGFATQWADTNAYMPFILFGAIAASVAVAGMAEVVSWTDESSRTSVAVATVLVTVLSGSLVQTSWQPQAYVPSADQRRAGDELIELMRSYEGRVFAPFFPWYTHLAGERPAMHIMSKNDVLRLTPSVCPPPGGEGPMICPTLPERGKHIKGWPDGVDAETFSAVIVPALSDLVPQLTDFRRVRRLGQDKLPYPPTGYRFRGMVVMRPEQPTELPDEAEMVFDFEGELTSDWNIEGRAWGDGPVTGTLPGQQPVGGYGGDRFMNSYHGGDGPTGVATSPVFEITRPVMHLSLGGGRIGDDVRAELVMDEKVVKKAGGARSEMMREVTWEVGEWVGREARLRLVDGSSGGWGHLTVDDVWLEGALGERSSMDLP